MEEMPNATLVDRLRGEAMAAVESVAEPGSRCALVGFPNHTNPGDLGIWLAAKALLTRAHVEIVYECGWRDYSQDALAEAVAGGAHIVFTGGGNFGDLWPATHALRERVLEAFPGVPFVQLPQTIYFQDAGALERTRALLTWHGNVVLMVRDAMSHAIATRALAADVRLVPDLAWACPLAPQSAPVNDIVLVAREDRESRGLSRAPIGDGVWRVDWNLREHEAEPADGEAPPSAALLGLIEANRALTKRAAAGSVWRELARVRDELARARFDRGCALLGRGRVIVTDSLHAHIVGLMYEIPTVVTDNSYGKLRATFDTFTHPSPLAAWADTPAQALAVARDIGVRRSPP